MTEMRLVIHNRPECPITRIVWPLAFSGTRAKLIFGVVDPATFKSQIKE
jgi:hypothetical protein